jgi:hypothetical protein
MSFLTETNAEIRRIHKRFTKELTVYNYEWSESGGSNEYADGDWTTSMSTVDGSIRLAESIAYEDSASGEDVEHDVNIYVNPEEINLTVVEGDESRPTEFVDENNRRYKAVGFKDESSLYEVQCREVE